MTLTNKNKWNILYQIKYKNFTNTTRESILSLGTQQLYTLDETVSCKAFPHTRSQLGPMHCQITYWHVFGRYEKTTEPIQNPHRHKKGF